MSTTTPEPLLHKNGGTITRITGIGHETYKGVATWHFLGDVTWNDGTQSKGAQIAPYALCAESGGRHPVLSRALDALNGYLQAAGEYHETKFKKDGRAYGWTPHSPNGQIEVQL